MATTELVFKIRTDSADFKSTMAQVRSELTKTGQIQSTVSKSELSTRQQLAASQSLQRQRSAALIGDWKRAETAARSAAAGTTSFKEVLDGLSRSVATIQGPLGGVAGRFSSIGSLFTELTSSSAGVAVGIGAIVAAAAAGAVAVFKLTTAAAEFQGKMFDLSQQVGVSVETLSALDILARQTGGSIESITQSLVIFQGNLEDAQDPASEMAKRLKTLGIETNNTEEAFRQALSSLAAMPEGFQQTDEAAQLFGRRGGKQINAILKETKGDIDGAMDRFRQMNILITTESAQAADEFNDQMVEVGRQIQGIANLIGNEAMPEIQAAIKAFSNVLVENQGVISGWIKDIGDAARGAGVLAEFVFELNRAVGGLAGLPIPPILSLLSTFDLSSNIFKVLKFFGTPEIGALPVDFGPVPLPGTTPPRIVKPRGGRGGGRSRPRDTALQDATRGAGLAEREALLITEADITENKRALQEQVRTIEDFTQRAIELDGLQLDAKIDRITAESDALDAALAKRLIKQDEYENRQRDLDLDAAKAHQDNKDEAFKLERERDLQISEQRVAARRREEQIQEEADQREITRTDKKIQQGVISEAEGERRIAVILEQGFERRKKLLEEESDAYSTSLERRKDITAELIRLDGQRVASAEDAARRIFEAENEKARGATRNRRFAIDKPEITSSIDQLFEAVKTGLTGDTQTAALAGLEAMTMGFELLGQAVGQAVHAFVLYGSAGTSVRKVTAEVLASIAQMAATKAIFHLAEGFAAMAMAFFGIPNAGLSAAAHFKAAAIYGVVAGVAALAGRGVAGNSFNTGSGGAGGGERTGGPEARREAPDVRDINRRGSMLPPVTVVIRGEATESFEYRVEKVAVGSVRGNGVFRKIQNGEDV